MDVRQRRVRGTGSIMRRSRDGLWAVQFDLGYVDGKRKRRTLYAKSRADAAKLAAVGCCVYCGATEDLEQDHATPISRGGDNSIGNVVPSCAPCNRAKGVLTAAEFLVDRILAANGY